MRLGGALLVFVIGKWISQVLAKLVERALQKAETDATLTRFLKNLTYFGLLILVIIAALGTLGVNTTSFSAVIGAVRSGCRPCIPEEPLKLQLSNSYPPSKTL